MSRYTDVSRLVEPEGGLRVWPFFSCRAYAAIEGKPVLEQIGILREYVEQGLRDKLEGYGPPMDELNQIRRRHNQLINDAYGHLDGAKS